MTNSVSSKIPAPPDQTVANPGLVRPPRIYLATIVLGDQPATAFVRSGPYRFSRNPIYLAFSLLQLGLALLINSLTMVMTLALAVAVMALVVIPREERYLAQRFPSEYSAYKASTRRWL
jgi:protein-S-isoprenylcysteine O-methyltransferase Ste14